MAKDAGDATEKVINKKQFLALLNHADQCKTRQQSINGELGERVKNAVENANLDKKAFGLILQAKRMDELKREAFKRNFDLYWDFCAEAGLFGQEHVGDLASMAQETPEEDADAVAAAENTKKLEAGIKPLPEADAPGSYKAH
jgi:uncharacterized protein (UPF0335 family)